MLDAAQQPVAVTSSQFTMPNGPVIVAAKYLPVYTVSFNANGHGTAPDAQPVMQGYMAKEPAAPTANGYDFGGWYTTAACTGEAYDFTSAVSSPTELFAKWTAIMYYLNYDLVGGTVATENPISYTIESDAITLNNPTKDGYTFAGWTGTDITNATETVTIAAGSTGNREYIATWTQNTCTLTENDGVTSLVSTWQGKQVEVSFTRTFTSGVASTICLPFAFVPTGGTFYTFHSVDKSITPWTVTMEETNPDNHAVVDANGKLQPDVPYLFMPASTGDVSFSGTIPTVASSYTAGQTTVGATNADGTPDAAHEWQFKGTYVLRTWYDADPGNIYGFSANQITANGGGTIEAGEFFRISGGDKSRLRPFRACMEYVTLSSGVRRRGAAESESLPDRMTVRLIGRDGTTTAIGTLSMDNGQSIMDNYYDLSGRKLDAKPTKKGIYIHNGKKVVIK